MDIRTEIEEIARLQDGGRASDARARAAALDAAVGPDDLVAACEALVGLLDADDQRAQAVAAAERLGHSLALLDRRAEAVAVLRAVRERRRALARQPFLLDAYRALGRWHTTWGEIDEAESALRTAIQQARTWGDPVELGLCLLDLARALARTPRRDRALLAYTEAIGCLAGRAAQAHARAVEEFGAFQRVPGGAR